MYIRWLDDLSLSDINLVGGKNASLGEMYGQLQTNGIKVPYGFAVTVNAYDKFIDHNNLKSAITNLTAKIIPNDLNSLSSIGSEIRILIVNGNFPEDLKNEIVASYRDLNTHYNMSNVDVAIRSSSISEDSLISSYAGQQDTYLNITTDNSVLEHIKRCYASLYTDRAISYRIDKEESTDNLKMSVGVQKMVRSDLACSGVAFTIDTESGFKNAIIINASYGLGELVVGGQVDPDEYTIFKTTGAIINKKLGSKCEKMLYDLESNTIIANTTLAEQQHFCLDDEKITQLGKWSLIIEQYYSKLANVEWKPMDIEWAKDARDGKLYIVQARPETIYGGKKEIALIAIPINNSIKAKERTFIV
jgi:pyruvate,water dikinase